MGVQLQKFWKDEAAYEFQTYNKDDGYLIMWRCRTCGSAGGTTRVFNSKTAVLAAAQRLISGHHRASHSPQAERDLAALVYCSRAVGIFDQQKLQELERTSAEKNGRLEITGYLHHDAASESFFQFLEGPRWAVEELMGSIQSDPRHQVLSLHWIAATERHSALDSAGESAALSGGAKEVTLPLDVPTRLFPEWRMKCVGRQDFRSLNLEQTLNVILISMRAPAAGGDQVCRSIVELCTQLSLRISPGGGLTM